MTLTSEDKVWIKNTIVESIVEVMETYILPRFEEIDRRFDTIDERFDQIDRRFDEAESNIRALHIDMTDVKLELKEVNGRLVAIESDVKELYYLQRGSAPSPA